MKSLENLEFTSIGEIFLGTPEKIGFLDSVRINGSIAMKKLSVESDLSDDLTLKLVELALEKEKLEGFFSVTRAVS